MDAFKTLENKLKLATAILGIVSIGLIARSYSFSYNDDGYEFAMVILASLFSIVLVCMLLLKMLPDSAQYRTIEMSIHLVFAMLLLIGWILFLIPAFKNHQAARYVALVFTGGQVCVFTWIFCIKFNQSKK